MNILKKATSKAFLSLTLATTLFFSPNINGSTAHADVGPISYSIDHEVYKKLSEVESNYNKNFSNKTIILTTNDVHGAVDGYPYLAGMKEYFSENGADVIVVDSGDFSQTKTDKKKKKDIYITPENGLAFKCMNSVGYNYATLGNHEGTTLSKLQQHYHVPEKPSDLHIISSNIHYYVEGAPLFASNVIHETTTKSPDSVKIGFFGLTTSEGKSSKSEILLGDAMRTCAQEQCDKLKADGADIIICLAHLGLENKFKADGERSVDVYNAVKDINLMVDGHSHSKITPPEYGKPLIYEKENGDKVNNEPILSTGTEFQNIGVVIIDNHEKAIEDAFLVQREDFESFEPISPKVSKAAAATAEVVEAVKKESQNGSKKQ